MLPAPGRAEALRRKLAILFQVHFWGKPGQSQGQEERFHDCTSFARSHEQRLSWVQLKRVSESVWDPGTPLWTMS